MNAGNLARFKIVYLISLSCALFLVNQLWMIAAIGAAQLVLYFSAGLSAGKLFTAYKRLFLLMVIIIISYLLIPSIDGLEPYRVITPWLTIPLYYQELPTAAVMLLRIFTLLTVSLWVRDSEKPGEFIKALRWMKIPEVVAIAIDAGIQLSGRKAKDHGKGHSKGHGGGGKGDGKGGGKNKNKLAVTFAEIKAGKLSFFENLLNQSHQKANRFLSENYPDLNKDKVHDAAIILTIVAAVMALKLLQLLPGLPIAPGHKNLVIVPLIVIAALTTKGRWGAFSATLAVGIVSFMMGYGKFGIFEIAHFAIPGLLADLLAPIFFAGNTRLLFLRFALFGAIIGATRFAANFLIILLAGAPPLAWVAFAPMLLSQIVFGALSALIGIFIIKKAKQGQLFQTATDTDQGKQDVNKGKHNV